MDLNGTIVDGAPIIRKFIGAPLQNLRSWMWMQGGFKEHELD